MAKIYDFKRYVFVDDDFYFLPNPPPVNRTMELDGLPVYDVLPSYTPPTWWELFTRRFGYWWAEVLFDIRHSYWLVIGFVVLIFVPSLIVVRRRILRPI